jgi:hypothetical protein
MFVLPPRYATVMVQFETSVSPVALEEIPAA